MIVTLRNGSSKLILTRRASEEFAVFPRLRVAFVSQGYDQAHRFVALRFLCYLLFHYVVGRSPDRSISALEQEVTEITERKPGRIDSGFDRNIAKW